MSKKYFLHKGSQEKLTCSTVDTYKGWGGGNLSKWSRKIHFVHQMQNLGTKILKMNTYSPKQHEKVATHTQFTSNSVSQMVQT